MTDKLILIKTSVYKIFEFTLFKLTLILSSINFGFRATLNSFWKNSSLK